MTKTLLKFTLGISIMILMFYALNFIVGGNQISWLSTDVYNGMTIYKVDAYSYFKNLELTFTEMADDFFLTAPDNNNWSNSDIIANLKMIVNYLIFTVNIMIFPFRAMSMVVKMALGIMGFTVTRTYIIYLPIFNYYVEVENTWWVYQVVNTFVTLEIPLIP